MLKSGHMDQLEEIKSKIDIVQFISETVPLKKAGRNFKGLCPFHTEKTPSFMVSPERQIWKCFGCQKGGDVFTFLMETERVEFGEALRILAKKAGVVLQSYRPTQSETEKEKLFQINHLAEEFFHYLLLKHPVGKKALDYILQRGISKESLEQFKLGYAPAMWDGLQKFLVGKKGFDPTELEKAGLLIQNSKFNIQNTRFYDRFRDRLMFPLSDHRGNIVGFAGRVLDPTIKEAKYVNTPETLVYHKSELLYPLDITKEDVKKENLAVVVEGELDAISSYQAGIKNIVAIKGSALTEEQSRLLKRFAENVVLSLDADVAGDMAARRGIEIAEKAGLNIRILTLEKYKDPDEAAQKEPDYLKKRLTEAENIYDFFLDSAFKRFRGTTAEEKKKIGQEIVPIFAKIEDEIVKDVFVQKLANRLGVSEEAIILQMEKSKEKKPYFSKSIEEPEAKKDRQLVLEEYYLSLLFQSKKPEVLLEETNQGLISFPVYIRLIFSLKEYQAQKKKFSSQFFYSFLSAELRDAFNNLYLIDFGDKLEEEKWVEKEMDRTKRQLRVILIKKEIRLILENLRLVEDKDELEAKKLKEKLRKLTAQLGEMERNL